MAVDENFLVQWLQKNDVQVSEILAKMERLEVKVAEIANKQKAVEPEHEFTRQLMRAPKIIAWIISIAAGLIGIAAFFHEVRK